MLARLAGASNPRTSQREERARKGRAEAAEHESRHAAVSPPSKHSAPCCCTVGSAAGAGPGGALQDSAKSDVEVQLTRMERTRL